MMIQDSGTTIWSVDVGVVVAALAPTIAIIVTAVIAARTHKTAQHVLTLVNDQMTQEKRARLSILRANLLLLESAAAPTTDVEFLRYLGNQITALEAEIAGRDKAAARADTS
jgi:hypothetical protein